MLDDLIGRSMEISQNTFRMLRTPARGDKVSVRRDHPEHRLTSGSLGTVLDVLGEDLFTVGFGFATVSLHGDDLRIDSYSDCS